MKRFALGSGVALTTAVCASARAGSLYASSKEDTEEKEALSLKQVVIIFRHGDRTPITSTLGTKFQQTEEEHAFWLSKVPPSTLTKEWAKYHPAVAKDGHQEEPVDSQRIPNAMLTTLGATHMQSVGAKLRERYQHFLADVESKNVYAKSSNFLRTTQTAQNVLLGLFPPSDTKQVIPIETVPVSEEIMFPNGFICPRQLQLIGLVSRGELQVAIKDDENKFAGCSREGYKKLSEELSEVFGVEDGSKLSLSRVSEVLNCRQSHGLPLPEGIHEELVERIAKYHTWRWTAWYSSKELCRLGVGRLISDIRGKIVSRANGTGAVKVAIYSGHDSTILPLLCAFEVFDNEWPNYGSTLVIELWADERSSGKHFVRFVYNDKPLRLPRAKNTLCPLEEFLAITDELIPADFAKECAKL